MFYYWYYLLINPGIMILPDFSNRTLYLIVSGFIFQLHIWRNVLISYAMHILIASATLLICIYFKNFMCTCTQFSIMLCSQNGKKTFLKKRIERGKITFIFTPLITLDFYELRNEYLWPTYITSYYIHIVVFIYTYM